MKNLDTNGASAGGCSSEIAPSACCRPDEKSACCNPQGAYWRKGKTLLAAIIIAAAIGVGAVSFMKGNPAQSVASPVASSAAQCETAASCPSSGVKGTSTQPAAPNSTSCCPAQSQCGAAPDLQQRN